MARMVGKLFGWVDCENGEAKLLTPLREEYNIRLWDLSLLAFCSNVTQASGFLPHIAWDATLNPTPPHFRSALRHWRQAAEAHAKVLKHVEAMQSYLLCLTTSYVDSAAQVLDSCWLAKTRGLPARLLNRLPKEWRHIGSVLRDHWPWSSPEIGRSTTCWNEMAKCSSIEPWQNTNIFCGKRWIGWSWSK